MVNEHICFASWDDYPVIRVRNKSASKLVGDDPHARLFYLNGKTMTGWVIIATDALDEDDDSQNYIDLAMLLTCTFSAKAAK